MSDQKKWIAGVLAVAMSGVVLDASLFAQDDQPEKRMLLDPQGLPPCDPGDHSVDPIFKQSDEKGNTFEIYCRNGQYLFKFIRADGSWGYVGKCPFATGRNNQRIGATIRGDDVRNPVEYHRTHWISLDAPPIPEENPNDAKDKDWVEDREDRHWIYSVEDDTLQAWRTQHSGRWAIKGQGDEKRWEYEVDPDSFKRVGEPTTHKPPPQDPAELAFSADPPPQPEQASFPVQFGRHVASTVVPILETVRNEKSSYMVRVTRNGTVERERVFATINQLFRFDIERPPERQLNLQYALLNAPAGMSIDATAGVISWTPVAGHAGFHYFVVRTKIPGFSPIEDEFALHVEGRTLPDVAPWVVTAFIVVMLISCLWIIRRKRRLGKLD
jgi:hypothetical protein